MQHILRLNPSKIRALAHRRMALSALRTNSSLATCLKRYNDHMSIARELGSARQCRVNWALLVPFLSLAYIGCGGVTKRSSCALVAMTPPDCNSSIKHSQELPSWVT